MGALTIRSYVLNREILSKQKRLVDLFSQVKVEAIFFFRNQRA